MRLFLFVLLCSVVACLGGETTYQTTWQGRTYILVMDAGISWADASSDASSTYGGFLATVTNTEEHEALISLLRQDSDFTNVPVSPQPHRNFWLGARKTPETELWKWQTGPEQETTLFRGRGDDGECLQALCPWRINSPETGESTSGSEPNSLPEDSAYLVLAAGVSDTGVQFNFKWNDLPAAEHIYGYFVEVDASPFVPTLPSAEADVVFMGANPDFELRASGAPNASVSILFSSLHKIDADGQIEASYEYSALTADDLIVAPSFLVNNEDVSPGVQRRGAAWDFGANWDDEVGLKLRLGAFSSNESRSIEFAGVPFDVDSEAVKLSALITPLEQQHGVGEVVWRLDIAFDPSAAIGPFVTRARKAKKIPGVSADDFGFSPEIVSHTLSTQPIPEYGGRRARLKLSLLNFALVDRDAIPTLMPEPVFWPDLDGVSIFFPQSSELLVYDPDMSLVLRNNEEDDSEDHTVVIVAVTASVGGVALLVVLAAAVVGTFLWWRGRESADGGVVGFRDEDSTL